MARKQISILMSSLVASCLSSAALAAPGDLHGFRMDPGFDDRKQEDDAKRKKEDKLEEHKEEVRSRRATEKGTRAKEKYDTLRSVWTSDFMDTDFSGEDFQDLGNLHGKKLLLEQYSGRNDDDSDSDRSKADTALPLKSDPRKEAADDAKRRKEELKRRLLADEEREFDDLTKPIPGMLHDWVPSKPDRGQNGGFTTPPFNGSPVPYTLNGWVEIERKLPWEAEP